MAERWIPVGAFDILVPATKVRGASTPAGAAVPYFVWTSGSGPVVSEYLWPGFDGANISTANPAIGAIIAPRDCTLRSLLLTNVLASNGPAEIELYLDEVATGLSITILAGETTVANDVGSVDVLRGQRVQAFVVSNTGIPTLQFSVLML